mgnify:CR=1 FL=1
MNLRRSPNDLITLHIYRKEWRLKAQVRPQSEVISTAAQHITPAVSATPPPTEEDRPIPPFVISLCKKIPRLLPYLIVLLLGMLIWHFRLDIFSPSHEHSTLASSLIITQDTKSQVVLLKEAPSQSTRCFATLIIRSITSCRRSASRIK